MSIAADIRDHLEARILSGRNLPGKLTVPELAGEYGVSFTPVRAAIEELVDRGVLVKQANRRLSINDKVVGSAPKNGKSKAPRTNGTPDVEETLARHVLLESLRGEPVFLREEAIADQYGVGRTVVRQTFGRFAGAGVLEHVPRRGWRVRPFRDEDLTAYLEIRETLELKALDLARSHLVREDIERMLEGNRVNGREPKLDNDLHGYFVEKSGNRYIQDFFAMQGGYYRRLFDYAAVGDSYVAKMASQHREILEAVLAKRWGAAKKALANHIQSQRAAVERVIVMLEEER